MSLQKITRSIVMVLAVFMLLSPLLVYAQEEKEPLYLEPDFLVNSGTLIEVEPYGPEELKDKIREATQYDMPEVEYTLGHMYQHGSGVYRDYKRAEKWYLEAAKSNHIPSMVAVGRLYKLGGVGTGLPQCYSCSLKWFHSAAKQRSYEAWYELGLMYEAGHGVFQSDSKALQSYAVASEGGLVNAYIKQGLFYQYGRGTEKNIKTAVSFYDKARKQTESPHVQRHIATLLGGVYHEIANAQKDPAEAIKWLILAAEHGDVKAQIKVANAYRDGKGVWQDYNEAIKWYKLAAQQEHIEAMTNLGYIYNNGLGVEVDYCEAMKWYTQAAEGGNAEAAWNVGGFYFNGLCVEKDDSKADQWFKRAEALRRKIERMERGAR